MGIKRIAQDIARDVSALGEDKRWQNDAVHALREAGEMYLVNLFADAQLECNRCRQDVSPSFRTTCASCAASAERSLLLRTSQR